MDFKLIDTKRKEMYFNIRPITDEDNIINARYVFWAKMNDLATQNIVIQNMKVS